MNEWMNLGTMHKHEAKQACDSQIQSITYSKFTK